jgi:hypothetical protein
MEKRNSFGFFSIRNDSIKSNERDKVQIQFKTNGNQIFCFFFFNYKILGKYKKK